MKILFVLDSLSDWCGANVNIAITIKKQLKQIGCEVLALAKYDCKRPPSTNVMEKFDKVYFLDSDTFELFHSATNNHEKILKKSDSIFGILKHPGTLFKTIDILFFNAYFTKREFSKKIDEICINHNIDAVIGVVSPYYLAEAVAMSKTNAIRTVYQLDPYTNNYRLSNSKKELRRKIESNVIKKLDILFAANFVKDDLFKELEIESSKIIETNIPGIKVEEVSSKVYTNEEYSNTVDCLFAGKFYKDIRNPKYLLDIFSELPSNYILHIAGTGCEDIISSYKKNLGNRLIQYGQVSKQKVNELVQFSNILINVDNTINNQMPSKIVDYICTGKKIINFCKDQNTLSNHLLKNYSNGISVYENDANIESNIEKVIKFTKTKKAYFDPNDILENYVKYTDKFVSRLIFDTLSQFNKTI